MQKTPHFHTARKGADSLKAMAKRTLSRHLRHLVSLGDCPPELVKSLFIKIDKPDQLYNLEQKSPQIQGHTREAWVHLIKRDVPPKFLEAQLPEEWQTVMFPLEKADRWHKIYYKLKKMAEKEQAKRDVALAATLRGFTHERELKTAPVIDRKLVSTGRNRVATAKFDFNNSLYRSGGKATGKAASGPGFFERFEKGAGSRRIAKLRTPTHLLKPSVGHGVAAAPAHLVEHIKEQKQKEKEQAEEERVWKEQLEQRKRKDEAQGLIRLPRTTIVKTGIASVPSQPMHAPNTKLKPNAAVHAPNGDSYDLIKDREARLRALKNGTKLPQPTSSIPTSKQDFERLTMDFLESDDEDSPAANDDLFEDLEQQQHQQYSSDANPSDEDLFGSTTNRARSASPQHLKPKQPPRPINGLSPARKQALQNARSPGRAATASPAPIPQRRPANFQQPARRPVDAMLSTSPIPPSRSKLNSTAQAQTQALKQSTPQFHAPDLVAVNGRPANIVTAQQPALKKRKAADPLATLMRSNKKR
ncbi:hypothetical protein LTS08_004987 [Lithohypha guttulata]|uniref:Elongin-A n=1 Tax=Lithohypha guttulata TaxID=1690604 RepID=A0AAN7T214_9EURO|nr:hypothetical protein LTR05_002166 [Lithohypha guttulata]KAK5101380.1 hypothetical protein LTS08_004987 [Lithohypha guttulata]